PSELGGTDAEVLAAASGETIHRVCRPHRWYAVPMAPPMAAKVLQLEPIWARDLMDEIEWPTNVDIGFVETVGGVCSPMADDVDSAEFIALLQPDRTILVADAGLGTINAVRLSGRALGSRPLAYLNHYDGSDLHRRNRQWLETNDGQLTAIDIPAVCDWILEPLDRSR
ncbi:MAG: hypothetical protein JWN99_2991, partial [Ilumatobacteraceae bacterium]|nr:hypothetical protein [Ilumatobacteraceae bacterium]